MARPPLAPTALRAAALSWFGVVGAAMTIVSSLDPLVVLAAWCRALVDNWTALLAQVWESLLGWLLPEIDPSLATFLSASVFVLALGVGSRLDAHGSPPPPPLGDGPLLSAERLGLAALFVLPFAGWFLRGVGDEAGAGMSMIAAALLCAVLLKAVPESVAYSVDWWRKDRLKAAERGGCAVALAGLAATWLGAIFLVAVVYAGVLLAAVFASLRIAAPQSLRRRLLLAFALAATILGLSAATPWLRALQALVAAPP